MNFNYLEYVKTKRDKNRKFSLDYLGCHCNLCNSKKNLEFDHIDKTSKFIDVSQMLTFSRSLLIEELIKCQLLCKKCHVNKSILERGDNYAIHGSHGMYMNHKCRCEKCRVANTIYYKNYRAKKKDLYLYD